MKLVRLETYLLSKTMWTTTERGVESRLSFTLKTSNVSMLREVFRDYPHSQILKSLKYSRFKPYFNYPPYLHP